MTIEDESFILTLTSDEIFSKYKTEVYNKKILFLESISLKKQLV